MGIGQLSSSGGTDDAEPVPGGVLNKDGYEFPGWVGEVAVVGFPNHPGHNSRRDVRKPIRKALCHMRNSYPLGIRRHPDKPAAVVNQLRATSATVLELSITSRTAASLNSGEYLPRWLATMRSHSVTPILLGGPARNKWGTSDRMRVIAVAM